MYCFVPFEPAYVTSKTVSAGSRYCVDRCHCCMYGVTRCGSSENNSGVFGSTSAFAGKPLATVGISGARLQSCAAGLAVDWPHGLTKFSIVKNGGLNPMLGFEYGPASLPP